MPAPDWSYTDHPDSPYYAPREDCGDDSYEDGNSHVHPTIAAYIEPWRPLVRVPCHGCDGGANPHWLYICRVCAGRGYIVTEEA